MHIQPGEGDASLLFMVEAPISIPNSLDDAPPLLGLGGTLLPQSRPGKWNRSHA